MFVPFGKTGDLKEDAMGFRSMASSYIFPCQDISDSICVLSNAAGVMMAFFERISWCGFYIWNGKELVLGPFQGEPACERIKSGRGVCGTAYETGVTQIVPDVELFPGHIACSGSSRSEMVVPVKDGNGKVIAVIDIDSAERDRFGSYEAGLIDELAHLLVAQNAFCGYPVSNS